MGLGKWLLGAGGLIAAPFTGGATLGPALGILGTTAGDASAARGQGRVDQQTADIQRNNAIINQIQADLAQKRYTQSNYQTGANNAVRGGLLTGLNDVNITGLPAGVHMPTITGGARPSAIDNKVGIGQLLERHGIDQMNAPGAGLPAIPQLPAQPQAGKLDKFLNIFGTIAPLLGELGSLGAKKPTGIRGSGGGGLRSEGMRY